MVRHEGNHSTYVLLIIFSLFSWLKKDILIEYYSTLLLFYFPNMPVIQTGCLPVLITFSCLHHCVNIKELFLFMHKHITQKFVGLAYIL